MAHGATFYTERRGVDMDAPRDKAFPELIERSRSLIQHARELKADQDKILRQLEQLQESLPIDEHH